jgi:hypothetical protein
VKRAGSIDAVKYDVNLAPCGVNGEILAWHSPTSSPFRMEGFPFFAADGVYRRLPVNPPKALPEAVDGLAWHTAGGQIRFRSDSVRVALKVRLRSAGAMVHMAGVGQNGFDLYVGPPGRERFFNCSKYELKGAGYEALLFPEAPGGRLALTPRVRDFTLNFPLYTGVSEVLIGLDPSAKVLPPRKRALLGKVVVYGTSITQGGCASRPGTCYTNILARRLNVEFMNLGFSGSGQGEPEVAESVALVEDPLMFVMDYEANCNDPVRMRATLGPFVDTVRGSHPNLPVLVISRIRCPAVLVSESFEERKLLLRDIQRSFVAARRKDGDLSVHFLDGQKVLGDDFDECTVDGSHPTDLGFMRMARSFEPVFRKILRL